MVAPYGLFGHEHDFAATGRKGGCVLEASLCALRGGYWGYTHAVCVCGAL